MITRRVDAMKTSILCLTALVALSACSSREKAFRNQAATVAWLAGDGTKPRVDVTGSWFVPGWGSGYLAQTGSRITGYVDGYPISGVVRDRTINLAISEDGTTKYTGVVVPTSGTRLEGFYSATVPYDPRRQRGITFEKISR